MPEPMDTVRRVNSDEPMTVQELQQARAVLDRYITSGKVDVREARRRVGEMLAELEPSPATPLGASTVGLRPEVAKANRNLTPAGGVAAIVLVLLVGGCWIVMDRSGEDADGAIAYCHQFVEDRLKSPSSADFPSFTDHDVTTVTEGRRWVVSSYVDAENSFGASIRTDWTCAISYDEDAERWTLENLSGL